MAQVAALKSELEANEVRLGELLKELDAFLATAAQPAARERADRQIRSRQRRVKRWGTPRASTLPSRITSISAKRSVSSTSPPPPKLPARASA
jgi:septal ring factor EnvC (AmiA/AmiB activator)